MSTLGLAGASRSWSRTAALLIAQFAGFAVLLFVTRFIARGHLVPQMDQECHVGGIAVDVLAHGIRFPLLVYGPNEYDNGSFFSGLLAAVSFALLGRSVLALKLVTHLVSAAGAVATLWLLRGCLDELGLTNRRVRWVAATALVIALALAPRVVTLFSTYAVGNHAEGSAIDTILLALFSRRLHTRSGMRTAGFWALVGFALYVNKGTVLVIPVLGAAEIFLAWRSPLRLAAAAGGFVLGVLPELQMVALQYRAGWGMMGWVTIASKEGRNSQAFPQAFFDSLLFLGEYRIELLAAWVLAIAVGVALLVRSGIRYQRDGRRGFPLGESASPPAVPPLTLAMVVSVTWLHLAALTVMAKSGLDAYVIYGYPTLVVLFALFLASVCAQASVRWGEGAGAWAGAAAIALSLVLYRPDAVTWGSAKVAALWQNRAGAACSWRFAEGFERETDYGLTPGQTREQHAIERCRSLSEDAQILDCIGGIARELEWRQPNGRVDGEPPAELSQRERRAYAYQYGTHRKGNVAACGDFASPDLTATCAAAVELECLHYGDLYTQLVTGRGLARPRCPVPEPPIDGYWAATRLDLLSRTAGTAPNLTRAWGDDDLRACRTVFDACY
jgi:hypothetical protein